MNKCRLASELSDEDANITEFPEDDSVDIDVEDENESSVDVTNQANLDAACDVTYTSQARSAIRSSNPSLQAQQYHKNGYNFRKR